MDLPASNELFGLAEMGSNGIRFSISNLSAPTARIMPTLFQDRAGISLYDAQFKPEVEARQPIADDIQRQVILRLLRFKETCEDFGVPPGNIHVLATEATRTAVNSSEFTTRIKEATGWETRMLSKEDEGRIGALGVATSLGSVEGLVMDLGGGSTQITWMVAKNGVVKISPKGSASLPYGAAALTRRLEQARKKGNRGLAELRNEMKANIQKAYSELDVPDDLANAAKRKGGFDLYLSGGGFRGWGYLLMTQSRVNPYPIPIINGFRVERAEFHDTIAVQNILSTTELKIFRVSERRASQVPAVAFLVNVLADSLPLVKDIQFCQGGVREGFLFDSLPGEVRSQDPLVVATSPYSTPSAEEIGSLLLRALPHPLINNADSKSLPSSFSPTVLSSVSNLMYAHLPMTKESCSAAALYSPINGPLGSAHGLSHTHRAILSLTLYDRWSGELSPSDQPLLRRLRQVVSIQEAWWCRYLGRVAAFVGYIYPAGVVRGAPRVDFQARWVSGRGKKGRSEAIELVVKVPAGGNVFAELDILNEAAAQIEKIGKKKHWIKAAERVERTSQDWGFRVEVVIERSL